MVQLSQKEWKREGLRVLLLSLLLLVCDVVYLLLTDRAQLPAFLKGPVLAAFVAYLCVLAFVSFLYLAVQAKAVDEQRRRRAQNSFVVLVFLLAVVCIGMVSGTYRGLVIMNVMVCIAWVVQLLLRRRDADKTASKKR